MNTEFKVHVDVSIGLSPGAETLIAALVKGTPHEDSKPLKPTTQSSEVLPATDKVELPAPTMPTVDDVKAAMHATRERIEGADYANNTDSEGYKKYHKQLTSTFKTLAAEYGADKPSLLQPEKRRGFIMSLGDLIVKPDGTIGTDLPF